MNDSPDLQSSVIGLDLGTSRIVAARRRETEILFTSQLNSFAAIPYSKITQGVLQKERIHHLTRGSELIVFGDESERFSNLFHTETHRPMRRGILNRDEPDGAAMIRQMLLLVLGERNGRAQKVCFSVPAGSLGENASQNAHQEAIAEMLRDLNYEPCAITEGLAAVYGELESSGYTGIAISCGAGLCNVCLSYLSVPVTSFSIPKGGDYVDEAAAGERGESVTRVRAVKEQSFAFNGHFLNKLQQSIADRYDDMIRTLVVAMKDAFAGGANMPKLDRPLPLVLAGGSALAPGFRDRFESVLRETAFPLPISEVRLAANPLNSTARGTLVAALNEAA